MQQKDVIYIDVEDDITSIIGKVKEAKLKIVALVPPKRTGVLQSAVNLKLLARAANNADKRLVIITANAALGGLAASAEIPVAKNLHSRPEIATTPDLDDDGDDEDVIDGGTLPVSDHAKSSKKDADDEVSDDTIGDLDIDGESAPVVAKAAPAKKESNKRGMKVPDFGSFRKRLAIGGGIGALVIAFLIWAIWFAPHATVVVSAKTTGQTLSVPVTLGPDVTTDSDQTHIKSVEQTFKDTQSVDFEATGKKNIGDKAIGSIKMQSCVATFTPPSSAPAGLTVTTGGHSYITQDTATFSQSSIGNGCIVYTSNSVGITAAEGGADFNVSNADFNVSGSISAKGSASGGTDKMATVVTQDDIDKAKEKMADTNKDDATKKLKAKFDKDDVLIDSSLTTTGGDPTSTPAMGKEAADGKAKLTSEVTYTMSAVPKDEMNAYLDSAFDAMLTSKDSQRVYDNGLSTVNFSDFKAGDTGSPNDSATLTATAQIGPKINDNDIKEQVKGKRVGEIIGDIKAIDGVDDVDVKLSPFWVQGVPDDVKKISVEFKLKDNG